MSNHKKVMYALTVIFLSAISLEAKANNPFGNLIISCSATSTSYGQGDQNILNANKLKDISTNTAAPSVAPLTVAESLQNNNSYLFKTKKSTLLIGTLCVSYMCIIATLYGMAHICQQYCYWATWNNKLSLPKLRKLPERDLAVELFEELNVMYYHENNEDFLGPLVCFMNAIDREIKWHKSFLFLHSALDYCLIFPQQQSVQKRIAQQYERLTYIRSLVMTWLTSYTQDEKKV